MRRRVSFLFLLALAIVWLARPALAGGSWLDARPEQRVSVDGWDLAYAGTGDTVAMHSKFSRGQQAAPSAGPWYAYLELNSGAPDQGGELLLLGPVDIANTGGYPFVAKTTFVMPDVPTGTYWVRVCDLGCTGGVGDLEGGEIAVAPTTSEARLFARLQIERRMHDGDEFVIERLERKGTRLRSELEATQIELERATAGLTSSEQRLDETTTSADRLESELNAAQRSVDRWRLMTAILVGIVIVTLAIGGIRRFTRRRRLRVAVPDTPEALMEPEQERTAVGTRGA